MKDDSKFTPEKEPGHLRGGRMPIAEISSTRGADLDRGDGILTAQVGISVKVGITSASRCGPYEARIK